MKMIRRYFFEVDLKPAPSAAARDTPRGQSPRLLMSYLYPYGMPSFAPSSPESYGMPSFAPSSPESPFPGTGDFGTGVAAALDTYRTTVDAGRTSKPAPSNFVNAPHFAARAKPAGAAGSFGTAAGVGVVGVGVVGVGVVEAGALHAPQPPLRRPELEHTHLAAAWALDE